MSITIYRRGEVWHYRGTVAGRLLRGSTGTQDKATAARIAAETEAREWKGRLDGPASVLTFAQAAILYRKAEKSDRFLRKIEDYWRDTPVRSIAAGSVRQSAIVLEPTAGPATRNRHVIVPTQAVINHAASLELCARILVKRFAFVSKEKTPATWEWVEAFMAHAGRPNLAALTCFMFLTAARIGEAVKVTWADVDLNGKTVLIRQTKVGNERRAHLPPELVIALANIPGKREGRIFGFAHPHNIKTQWEGAIRRAGIKRLSPHCCRHGFATTLLQAGVDPVTVAKRGGWKSPAHVFATYGHAMDDPTVVDKLTQGKHGAAETAISIKAL